MLPRQGLPAAGGRAGGRCRGRRALRVLRTAGVRRCGAAVRWVPADRNSVQGRRSGGSMRQLMPGSRAVHAPASTRRGGPDGSGLGCGLDSEPSIGRRRCSSPIWGCTAKAAWLVIAQRVEVFGAAPTKPSTQGFSFCREEMPAPCNVALATRTGTAMEVMEPEPPKPVRDEELSGLKTRLCQAVLGFQSAMLDFHSRESGSLAQVRASLWQTTPSPVPPAPPIASPPREPILLPASPSTRRRGGPEGHVDCHGSRDPDQPLPITVAKSIEVGCCRSPGRGNPGAVFQLKQRPNLPAIIALAVAQAA